jgi:hypothetical protein
MAEVFAPVLQVYDVAPFAVKVAVPPEHTVDELADKAMVGDGVTVSVTGIRGLVQPGFLYLITPFQIRGVNEPANG